MQLRSYDRHEDLAAVHRLWLRTLGDTWPLTMEGLNKVIGLSGGKVEECTWVLELAGEIVGFAAADIERSQPHVQAGIKLVMVAPERQRQGYGRKLLQAVFNCLQEARVNNMGLGAHGGSYFWPGVPDNLMAAENFFAANGWRYDETCADLIQDIRDYFVPDVVREPIRRNGVHLSVAAERDATELLQFEAEHFPYWHRYFELAVGQGFWGDILLVRGSDQRLIGTTLISDPGSTWEPSGILWQEALGERTGSIGCLGVMESCRERGLGLMLAAYATEALMQRGIVTSYLGWTGLVDWYGKLGYRVWRRYKRGSLSLL